MQTVDSLMDLAEMELVPRGEDPSPVKLKKPKQEPQETKVPVSASGIIQLDDDDEDLPDDFVWDAMQRAYDPLTNTIRDLKIDDSDHPRALNYWHFCSKIAGSSIKSPFSRQLWIAYQLFGEFCPFCTPKKYMDVNNVPVDMDSRDLVKKITLLENGRCPKCTRSKASMVLSKELIDYNQLVMVAGQRAGKCIEGDSLILSDKGFVRIDSYLKPDTPLGFSDLTVQLSDHNGDLCKTSKFYKEKKYKTRTITLHNGQKITGTFSHPIWTENNWTNLADISVGMYVPVFSNQDVWPKKMLKLKDVAATSKQEFTAWFAERILGKHHQVKNVDCEFYNGNLDEPLAEFLGFWVSEGSTGRCSITNNDQHILDLCENQMKRLFGVDVKRKTNSVSDRTYVSRIYLNNLVGDIDRNSYTQKIPDKILQSPKPIMSAFLRALFEGDGYVSKRGGISYSSVSEQLIKELQIVLLNYGIHSRISSKFTSARNTVEQRPILAWHLGFSGPRSTKLFKDQIGFLSKFKQGRLDAAVLSDENRKRPNPGYEDKLPAFIRDEFLQELLTAPDTAKVRKLIRRYTHGDGLSKYKLEDALNHIGNQTLTKKFKHYLDPNVVWVKIDSVVTNEDLRETYDFTVPKTHTFMANGLLSHNSALTSTMSAYHTHLMLKSPKMSSICRGIQEFTPLVGTYVALTTGQSIKLLWNPYSQIIDNSEWYQTYHSFLEHTGKQYGKELFRKSTLFLRYFHKNLDYYPSGPMKRTLRGATRIISATDELGLFPYVDNNLGTQDEDDDAEFLRPEGDDDQRERANGDEVHQSLDNSLATFRAEVLDLYKRDISTVPTGLNLNISSPFSWKDKIMRLLKESEDPATLSLGLRLPTWEINPIFSRDHPVITSAYAKNARRAERDYGANPPTLSATMFNKETVIRSFSGKQHHAIVYDEDNPDYTVGQIVDLVVRNKWQPNVMGLDAGLNNNSFAITIGNRAESTVTVHSTIELIPKQNRPVFYPKLYKQVILPMIKQCNVVYVGADRWNSINLLQQVEEDTKGRTKWMQLQLNLHHFTYFKDLVNSGNLVLPALDWTVERIEQVQHYRRELKTNPVEHLYLQFMTIREAGGQVMKGEGNTDDLFRSLVVMSTMLFIPKVNKYLGENKEIERVGNSNRAAVFVAGRSGMGYLR